jgi:drug/metabolite transporter (DMT)-like permease
MSGTKPLRLGPTEWALLLFLSVIWGGSFFFIEVLVEEVPPFTLVFGRVAIAALALWLLLLARGAAIPTSRKAWFDFLVMGSLNNAVPFALIAYAQESMTGGLASILNASTPLWTVLFASLMTRDERATPLKVGGVLVGIAGVAVIVGPAAFGAADYGVLPPLAIIAATMLYGFTGVFGRRLSIYDSTSRLPDSSREPASLPAC